MTTKSPNPWHSLTTRLVFARHAIARSAEMRKHTNDNRRDPGQPTKFSLLLMIGLSAVGIIAAISALQLLEAAAS